MEDGVLFYAEQHSRRLWSSLVKFAMKWRYFSFESLGKRFLIVSLDSFNLNRQVIWRRCNRNWCFSWIHIRYSTVWILPSQSLTLHWDFDSVPSKIDASPDYLYLATFPFFFCTSIPSLDSDISICSPVFGTSIPSLDSDSSICSPVFGTSIPSLDSDISICSPVFVSLTRNEQLELLWAMNAPCCILF